MTSATVIKPLKKLSRCVVEARYFTNCSLEPADVILGAIQFKMRRKNRQNMVKTKAMNWLLVMDEIHMPKAT